MLRWYYYTTCNQLTKEINTLICQEIFDLYGFVQYSPLIGQWPASCQLLVYDQQLSLIFDAAALICQFMFRYDED